MSNTMIQQIDRPRFQQAIINARAAATGNTSVLNALAKAGVNLELVRWYFDGETLKVESSKGDKWYTTEANRCTCPARGVCWHRVGRRLLINAMTVPVLESKVERFVKVSPAEAAIEAEAERATDADVDAWRDEHRGAWYKGQWYSNEQLARSRAARMAQAQAAVDEITG